MVPFQAAWIALLAPERREHVLVANHGYDDRLRAWLTSTADVAETELVACCDMLVPSAKVPGWPESLWPAGFRECLAVASGSQKLSHVL